MSYHSCTSRQQKNSRREHQRLALAIFPIALFLPLLFLIAPAFAADKSVSFTPEEQRFIQEHPVVVVGGETDWPPFDFVRDGEYTGVAKDYLDLLQKYTGITFKVKTGYTWDQLLQLMWEKQIDLLPMLYWSEQRTAYMHFTRPYLTVRHYVFVSKEVDTIRSMGDLGGKSVAIPKGYAQIELLQQEHPQIRILEVNNPLEAIDAVITQRADALIENTALVSHLIKENNIQGLKPAFATELGVNQLYMAVRKDWPVLRDIIQKGLDAISFSERYLITNKWISLDSADREVAASINERLSLTPDEQNYLQQKKVIKACVDPNWMPLEKLEKNRYTGIGADYLKIYENKIGIPIEVVSTQTWAQSVAYAKARRCDIFMLSMDTPARQAYMNITTPYLTVPVVIATKPDVLFISEFKEIEGKKIGIVEGYALADVVKMKNPNIDFTFVPNSKVGLQMVAEEKLFGFIDTISTIGYAIQHHFFGELKIGGKFGIDWDLGVAARNDEPLLGEIFERAVISVPELAKQEIFNRWMAIKFERVFDYGLLWQIIAIFSVILLFVFYRNLQLQKHRNEINNKNVELANINVRLTDQKEKIQHLADHDSLTGLPNRQNFIKQLEHAVSIAQRQQLKLAILFIDLDRFKNINDTLGHHVGDEMLKVLSRKLNSVLRGSDTLARVGGDEFIVLMQAISGDDDPAFVAEKIHAIVKEPINILEYNLNNTASIGIALFPNDGEDPATLIKNADSAMYFAKDEGKDNYQYYTKDLSEQIHRRLELEHALRNAVENQELSLHFQPQLDLNSGKVLGAEALLRWNHPELGSVSPLEFIPVAEDSGLIVDIGEWVFRNACQEFLNWRESDCAVESIAINVSSVQFNQGDIAQTFNSIIEQLGVDARHIEIEITEHYLMEHTAHNKHVLDSLRKIGFRISVDDFGTGYSSMSYLKALPLDTIKIDKSFIDDIPHDQNDVQITKAILAMSHSLDYTVIAEGIEKEEQLQLLRELNCNIGQGYLFSKPLPSTELIKFVCGNC